MSLNKPIEIDLDVWDAGNIINGKIFKAKGLNYIKHYYHLSYTLIMVPWIIVINAFDMKTLANKQISNGPIISNPTLECFYAMTHITQHSM